MRTFRVPLTNAESKLGDFKYDVSGKTVEDYTYDANGNMQTDLNKRISQQIEYNHLNLPAVIYMGQNPGASYGGGSIKYVYDAAGIKLRKIVTRPHCYYPS